MSGDNPDWVSGKELAKQALEQERETWRLLSIYLDKRNYFDKLMAYFPWFIWSAIAGLFSTILGLVSNESIWLHFGISILFTVMISGCVWAIVARILYERHKSRMPKKEDNQ